MHLYQPSPRLVIDAVAPLPKTVPTVPLLMSNHARGSDVDSVPLLMAKFNSTQFRPFAFTAVENEYCPVIRVGELMFVECSRFVSVASIRESAVNVPSGAVVALTVDPEPKARKLVLTQAALSNCSVYVSRFTLALSTGREAAVD